MSKRPDPKKFIPRNPAKYAGDVSNIISRSSWETRFMNWCDLNESVVRYVSEEVIINYICETDGQPHRYFPDFMMQVKTRSGDMKTYLVEIKPECEMLPPVPPKNPNSKTYIAAVMTYVKNQSKWKAAREWCEQRGIEFIVLNEYDLGIKKRR